MNPILITSLIEMIQRSHPQYNCTKRATSATISTTNKLVIIHIIDVLVEVVTPTPFGFKQSENHDLTDPQSFNKIITAINRILT